MAVSEMKFVYYDNINLNKSLSILTIITLPVYYYGMRTT